MNKKNNVKIIRSESVYGFLILNLTDIENFGWLRAYILAIIDKLGSIEYSYFNEFFPFVEQDEFFQALKELHESGDIEYETTCEE